MYRRIGLLALMIALVGVAVVAANEEPSAVDPPTEKELAELVENWQTLNDDEVLECSGATGNLLQNHSFEGQYEAYEPPSFIDDCPWNICMSAQMADEWTPYWKSHNPADESHIYRMPEWKAATTDFTNPPRVRSGQRAQQWFTFFGTHQAGIFQQVDNVTVGNTYCLSVWGHGWSSNGGSFTDPNSHGFLNLQIGIDPKGGTNYLSSDVVWTSPVTQYDEYGLFKLEVPAQADKMTVFFHSEPLWAWKHNDVYFDDAILVSKEPAAPATMTVTPNVLNYSAETESPVKTTSAHSISFSPAYNLDWTATVIADNGFAPTLEASSGSASDQLSVNINSTGLGAGSYQARIKIESSADNTVNDPYYIDVNLNVTRSLARFDLPNPKSAVMMDNDAPASKQSSLPVQIKNWNEATWTATSSGASWLSLQTPSGNNGDMLRFTMDSTGLPIGRHVATITLNGQNATWSNPTQQVEVVLIVADEVYSLFTPIITR